MAFRVTCELSVGAKDAFGGNNFFVRLIFLAFMSFFVVST